MLVFLIVLLFIALATMTLAIDTNVRVRRIYAQPSQVRVTSGKVLGLPPVKPFEPRPDRGPDILGKF